jgi:hypothetical protein
VTQKAWAPFLKRCRTWFLSSWKRKATGKQTGRYKPEKDTLSWTPLANPENYPQQQGQRFEPILSIGNHFKGFQKRHEVDQLSGLNGGTLILFFYKIA